MAQAGVAARSEREDVVPWWEELDSELFREFRATTIAEPAPPVVPVSVEPDAEFERERPVTWAPRAANGRRTVQITGHVSERNLPPVTRRAERNLPAGSPTLRRHERAGFQPDRAAMWAVVLGLLLILVAAASAHAAALPH
ncbi:MAG TPA: hypothetical protein VMG37_23350 [Solirubrobacteraceae bacterium]|nr:hypothetical protein [Solirubrobacteraceae bacterium]